jgi:DNA-binding transcriptional LysR family regulator
VSIFERQRSGVRLTRAGAEFVSACRSTLREIDLIISKAQMAGRGEAGYLRIGINASLSTGELRETLFDYFDRYPGVTVDLIERQRLQLVAYVNSRIVDIAILSGSTERRVTDAMTLWSERLMVALPQSHALASNERISWNDLRGERVLLSKEDHLPEILDYLRARPGISGNSPNLVVRDLSRENILHCIAAERAISLIHQSATGVSYPGILFREIDDDTGLTLVHSTACWSSVNDNPSLRRFLSLLRERYPDATPFPEDSHE